MSAPVVARLRGGCRICGLSDEARAEINKAIWPEGMAGPRAKGYRARAIEQGLEYAVRINAKSVATHADHVEQTWRTPTPKAPPTGSEVDVFDVTLDAMTDRAAQLGARAMVELEGGIKVMEAKDLVQLAKMGVGAVVKRETLRIKDRRPNINLLAVFGLVSGHVPDSARLEEQYPLEILEAELDAERRAYAVVRSDD